MQSGGEYAIKLFAMKRLITNLMAVVLWAAVTAPWVFFFVADRQFDQAARLKEQYLWAKAGPKFESAIRWDPYHAKFLAGYARYLIDSGLHRPDNLDRLRKAETFYRRAIALNPHEAYPYLGLARTLILRGENGFSFLKLAVQNDPNGSDINYEAGYSGLLLWEKLKPDERGYLLSRLAFALEVKPDVSAYIYARVLEKTKDPELLRRITPPGSAAQKNLYDFIVKTRLWQFRKEQEEIVNALKKKEHPEESARELAELKDRVEHLKVRSGQADEAIKAEEWAGPNNGALYCAGTAEGLIRLPAGRSVITIKARGTPAYRVWPYMVVKVDGQWVGETGVGSAEWKDYSFPVTGKGEPAVLSVTYVNDAVNDVRREDRNLFLSSATVVIPSP